MRMHHRGLRQDGRGSLLLKHIKQINKASCGLIASIRIDLSWRELLFSSDCWYPASCVTHQSGEVRWYVIDRIDRDAVVRFLARRSECQGRVRSYLRHCSCRHVQEKSFRKTQCAMKASI